MPSSKIIQLVVFSTLLASVLVLYLCITLANPDTGSKQEDPKD